MLYFKQYNKTSTHLTFCGGKKQSAFDIRKKFIEMKHKFHSLLSL